MECGHIVLLKLKIFLSRDCRQIALNADGERAGIVSVRRRSLCRIFPVLCGVNGTSRGVIRSDNGA